MRKLDRGCAWLIGCLLLVIAHAAPALPPPPQSWQHDIDRLVADDSAHPPPRHGVLFVGSSSIRMWATLAADFPGVPVIDRGFGGSAIADATYEQPKQLARRMSYALVNGVPVIAGGKNDAGILPGKVLRGPGFKQSKAGAARQARDLSMTTAPVSLTYPVSRNRAVSDPRCSPASA